MQFQQVTGTTIYFLRNWPQLTLNKFVLNLAKGIQIDFISTPVQHSAPKPTWYGDDKVSSIDVEIQKFVSKGGSNKIGIHIHYFHQA